MRRHEFIGLLGGAAAAWAARGAAAGAIRGDSQQWSAGASVRGHVLPSGFEGSRLLTSARR